jgi:hypothetical protein
MLTPTPAAGLSSTLANVTNGAHHIGKRTQNAYTHSRRRIVVHACQCDERRTSHWQARPVIETNAVGHSMELMCYPKIGNMASE